MFEFHSYWSKGWILSKHKAIEVQLMRDSTLICFEIDLEFKGYCHAGPRIDIAFLFHRLTISFPDSRHWNQEANRWKTPEEHEEEAERGTRRGRVLK